MTSIVDNILDLSQDLIRIPSVTVGASERLDEVRQAYQLILDFLAESGLAHQEFSEGPYPATLIGFPDQLLAPVMLSGHFDVVAPEPGLDHFTPRIEGDYLWGRGAGDMKTVVATYLIWMHNRLLQGPPYPPINLLLIGNEENGEGEASGTPHILTALEEAHGYQPRLFIAGERTEETGTALWGDVCIQNRGVGRFQVVFKGKRGHSGMSSLEHDLTQQVIEARQKLTGLAGKYLTLDPSQGWYSQIRFPFVSVGVPDVYNITPDRGVLGVELRGIPQDDLAAMLDEFKAYCQQEDLTVGDYHLEAGIACDPDLPELKELLAAVEDVSDQPAVIGQKLAGTSARFAPAGNGVVWGQSGLAPHAANERHYIPSILPYYQALDRFGERLLIHGANGG
jgi:acetylornithine deacetylase/succinyl-diaminopimelate desuccinylase-like protein